MRIKFLYRLLIIFFWSIYAATLLLTPMPPSLGPEVVTIHDKVVHAFIFGILAFFTYFCFEGLEYEVWRHGMRVDRRLETFYRYLFPGRVSVLFLIAALYPIMLSFGLEYLQSFVPGRSQNEWDFIASVVGIILFLLFTYGDRYSK